VVGQATFLLASEFKETESPLEFHVAVGVEASNAGWPKARPVGGDLARHAWGTPMSSPSPPQKITEARRFAMALLKVGFKGRDGAQIHCLLHTGTVVNTSSREAAKRPMKGVYVKSCKLSEGHLKECHERGGNPPVGLGWNRMGRDGG